MSANRSPQTAHINPDVLGLTLRLSDGFDKEYGAPDHFDGTPWMDWKGDSRTENGHCIFGAVTSPGEWGGAGISTRERQFNPGLKGTNFVEVTFVENTQQGPLHDHEFPPEHIGNPLAGRYITGMCLTIANYHGPIMPGSEQDRESLRNERINSGFIGYYRELGKRPSGNRGLQIHFDWMSTWGLDYFLCRGNLPEDYGKYAEWNVRLDSLEELIGKGGFIAGACFALAGRHYPADKADNPLRRRYGLFLTDDGNTLSWTLDGKVMDTVDISGYFTSDPEFARDGAYVSISGAGYQPHLWKVDDVKIFSS